MSQEAQNTSPVQLVKNVAVTQILGRIRTSSPVAGTPKINNTRWVVDIDTDGSDITLELLDGRVDRIAQTDLITGFMLAGDTHFYDAKPVLVFAQDYTSVTLKALSPCKYRLTLDIMHSMQR